MIFNLLKADIFELAINQSLAVEGWGWVANFSVSGGHSKNINLMLKVLGAYFLLSINVCHFLRFEDFISVGGVAHFNPLV